MHLVILKIKFGLLLCPYSHTRRATSNVAAVFKAHKSPVQCRIKRHIAVALDKSPKVGVALALIVVGTVLPIPEIH